MVMRWLNSVLRPSAPGTPASPKEVEAKVFKGRDRRVEIVGEAYYQRELAKLAGPKTTNGVSVYLDARLVPEPTNRHDRNAVATVINGHTVGYLSRRQAVAYHKAMNERGFGGSSLTGFSARIHGGWLRFDESGRDEGHYSVTLLLPQSIAQEIGFEPPDWPTQAGLP